MCSYFSCYLIQNKNRGLSWYCQNNNVKKTIHSIFAIYFEPNTCHATKVAQVKMSKKSVTYMCAVFKEGRQTGMVSEHPLDNQRASKVNHKVSIKEIVHIDFFFFRIYLFLNPTCCLS